MESITPMMSSIFRELAVICSMVATTRSTILPPPVAAWLDEAASWVAVRTVSALSLTVAFISSMEAAVCSRLLACSSVRWLRSALPEAIWLAPVAIDSLLCRTSATTRARPARMSSMARSRLEVSPGANCTCTDKSPCAIWRATPAA